MKTRYGRIHTIEIVRDLYDRALHTFNNTNVTPHLGDSPKVLKTILEDVDEPITFWLDAHYQNLNQPEDTKKPLLDELSVIKQHHINTHMIMIDDVRLFDKYGTSKKEIENLLLEINPEYTIEYFNGHVPNDVIVARIV